MESNLKRAQKGAYLSLFTYIILSAAKFITGVQFNSAALQADAFNNMTDILVSVAVLIGLKISLKPADRNHPYGHMKSENISTLLVSFIIMFVGLQVIMDNFPKLTAGEYTTPNPLTLWISFISGFIMLMVYLYNSNLAKKTKSSSLKSAAIDNLSDGMVSIGTGIGLIFTQVGYPIADPILALILGALIVWTGFKICKDAIFTLSDGFHEEHLEFYINDVMKIDGVEGVSSVKGRYHGDSVFLDVTIFVDRTITLDEAHDICDKVERSLAEEGVYSSYVHPEPYEED
ncbi:transporter [Salinicoccus sediminis]|uniref:Transporter n=1 Tax=Salinicoccus sediminis TaxID=1432562 RepID=A0A0M2SHE1_9STAP|nr:cation diffusion facilitator family transporter [Salinicoccus sediminis]KKK34134.1 transporter [Salinicoccus sediminis]